MLATKILSVAIAIIATFTINTDAKLFRTTDNLNIREQPTLKAKVLRVAPKGSNVDITCQTTGDTVDGKNIWDKLADGSYCFNAYVDHAVGLPRCDNSPANSFRTNANLNIREQPSLKAKVIRVAPKGSNLNIICQTTGDTVDGKNTWDKLADGTYCFDAYVDGAVGLPRCDNPPPSNSHPAPANPPPAPANPPPSSANNGKINDDGLNIIKNAEGFRDNFYPDSSGKLIKTIGYGHNCDADPNKCKDIHPPITRAQGEAILKNDLVPKEDCVKKLTTANINSNQFSALVSFTFNLGCGAYQKSSLLQKLNAGDIKGAANEFLLYNHNSKGKVLNGLTTRRKAERDLFCKS
ncbi:4844_t:CDS:2, partial [Gigaspora rosea]